MAEKLDEEKIQDVLDMYEREGTIKKTAEKTGVSQSTVRKYVERRLKDDDDGDDSDDSSGAVMEMTSQDDRLVDLTDQELMNLSEAEFIRTFFQEFSDMGVRDSFIEMVSNQAQIRHKIPDEDQMSQRLQSHNSGIGNANDANAIAELYWDLAQRYLNARGIASSGGGPGGAVSPSQRASSFGGGDWVSAPNGQRGQGRQQQGADGEWVDTNPGQQGGGQQGPPPQQGRGGGGGMEQMFQQMMAQQQQMMRTMMEQNEKSENDELREEIERLRNEVNSTDDGGDNMTDSLKEVMELRELLNEFESDDGDDRMEQVVGTLQQQLSALQQEIRNGNSSVDMAEIASGGDSQMGMLMALAQSGDVEANEMVDLAQKLGQVETNPQVAEKKYEKQIEEMKLEAEQEKWESIFNGVEELTASLGGVLSGEVPDELLDESDDAAAETEAQPVEREPEPVESEPEEAMSPAERMVSAGEAAEEEPSADEVPVGRETVAPDNDSDPEVEVEVAEEIEDGVDEQTGLIDDDGAGAENETDDQPTAADGGEYACTNDGCDRSFDSEMGRRGHLGSCPHGDN